MIRFEDHAGWLWALLILWVPLMLLFVLWAWQRKRHVLRRMANPELIQRLSHSISTPRRSLKEALRIIALLLLVLGVMGPKFSSELVELTREGVDVVVLLDVSNSMLAQDIVPSRLEKSKFELRRMVERMEGDRIALVVFAGQAHLQTPLTLDYSAFEMFLDIADESLIGVQGTAVEPAIQQGLQAFAREEEKYKTMILISDGEDHEGNLDEILQEAAANNVIIHTAGVGSLSGTPIPILDKQGNIKGYRKTREGEIVTTRLSTRTLEKISSSTGGRFVHLNSAASTLDDIYSDILGMEQKEFSRHEFTNFREQFHWFILAALLIFVAEFLLSDLQPRARDWEGRIIERE